MKIEEEKNERKRAGAPRTAINAAIEIMIKERESIEKAARLCVEKRGADSGTAFLDGVCVGISWCIQNMMPETPETKDNDTQN